MLNEGVGVVFSTVFEGVSRELFTVFVNCGLLETIVGVTTAGSVALKGGFNLANIIDKTKNTMAAMINKAAKEYPTSLM
jgi:hypothetical protein